MMAYSLVWKWPKPSPTYFDPAITLRIYLEDGAAR
jgi:hypothetical protein